MKRCVQNQRVYQVVLQSHDAESHDAEMIFEVKIYGLSYRIPFHLES